MILINNFILIFDFVTLSIDINLEIKNYRFFSKKNTILLIPSAIDPFLLSRVINLK